MLNQLGADQSVANLSNNQSYDIAATPEIDPESTLSNWKYSDDVPGVGDAPEWFNKDKYGSIEEQAKAYNDLYKKTRSRDPATNEAPVDCTIDLACILTN